MDNARAFTIRLRDLLRRERLALGDFLVALSDFDRRRLWVDLGYASLFDFLHRELGLSKASASFRKKAAELIQRFPELVDPIRDGRLCLTSVFELAKVLTPENRDEVLPRFFQLSKREAKAVAAALRPVDVPPVREMVTPVRLASPAGAAAECAARPDAPEPPPDRVLSLSVVCPDKLPAAPASGPNLAPAQASPARVAVEPLTAELNRLHVTVSRRFLEKLERARAALSHSHPGARADEILEAALDLVLDQHARRKGLVTKPLSTPRPSANPDHVPAHVRRAVWERDGGRCQWPTADGGVCGSTHRVQIDHRVAKACGGLPTVENLRCLCQGHNLLAAREAFGDECMDRYARNPRASFATSPGTAPGPCRRSRRGARGPSGARP